MSASLHVVNCVTSHKYQAVIDLLEPVRPHAKGDKLADIQDMLRDARLGSAYEVIATQVKSTRYKTRGCEKYAVFKQTYPDYPDPDGLSALCKPKPKPRSKAYDLLPAPFDWCEIPAGKVTLIPGDSDKENSYLKSNTTFDVPAFAIAKYPVTNAQFAKFIEAGGYKTRKWWTADGWMTREKM
jgi:formylglycine-generating enzyme required for sulfatase activity